jgi:DNA ligase-1
LQDELDELYARWLEEGYEGQMVRLDLPYEQKRSKTLLKRKEFQDAEYQVVAIEPGVGNWAGAAKKVICRLEDGREFGAGIKGTYARGVELLNEKHDTATVKFFALTPDGIPRFGVATAFHGTEGRL